MQIELKFIKSSQQRLILIFEEYYILGRLEKVMVQDGVSVHSPCLRMK